LASSSQIQNNKAGELTITNDGYSLKVVPTFTDASASKLSLVYNVS